MTAVMLCGVSSAQAQENRIYFDPFAVSGNEVVNVPIILDNPTFVAGAFQCNIELPSELEIAGDLLPSDRLNGNMQLVYGNGKIGIVNFDTSTSFSGDSGTLFYLPIREARGVEEDAVVTLSLTDVVLSADNGSESITIDDYSGYVKVVGTAPAIEGYSTESTFTIAQGGTEDFSFCFENNFDVAGFQVNITLPEGLSIEGDPVKTNRLTSSAYLQVTDRGNGVYNFAAVSLMGGVPVTGDTGAVFTLKIKADDNFNAENAEIVVDEFIASTANGKEVFGNSFSVKVSDTQAVDESYANALALVDELKAALDAALAQIDETCPLVKGDYNGEAILAEIDNLNNDIETAHADKSIAIKYANFEAEAANIKAEIEALVNEATEAEKAALAADNDARFEEVMAILDGLQAELSEAQEGVNPDDVEAEVEAAQNAINEAYAAAIEAFDNLAEGETYEYTVDVEGIQALIAAIGVKSETVAANLAAYNAQVEVLDGLAAKLDEAVADANENDVDVVEEADAALAAIAAEREAAANALETEDVFTYEVNAEEIDALIAKVGEEVDRVLNNRAAYADAIAVVDMLQAKLKDTVYDIAINYPGAPVDEAVNAAQEAIDNAREEAAAEFEAVAESGYYTYTVDADAIEALIEDVEDAAKKTGINTINIENLGNDVKVYNLNGMEIKNAQAGSMVIVRGADGSARKMIVK